MNIARTELAMAYNEGAFGAIQNAQEQGYIGDTTKTWLTAADERVCKICAPLDGVTVNMNAFFPGGMKMPPAHPQCRCAVAFTEITKPLQSVENNSIMVSGEVSPTPPEPDYQRYSNLNEVPQGFFNNLNSLPQEQKDALHYYTTGKYREVNAHLRTNNAVSFESRQAIERMDGAFASEAGRTSESVVAFRGTDPVEFGLISKQPVENWPGQIYTPRGYTSTSITEGRQFDGEVQLTINVPRGSRGILVQPISNIPSENELLLNRQTSFRIDRAEYSSSRREYRVEVTVIDAPLPGPLESEDDLPF
jgi:hypothetical protein